MGDFSQPSQWMPSCSVDSEDRAGPAVLPDPNWGSIAGMASERVYVYQLRAEKISAIVQVDVLELRA